MRTIFISLDEYFSTSSLGKLITMKVLDASGLQCPLPLLKLKMALKELPSGDSIRVLTTDSASLNDIPSFCRCSPNQLLAVSDQDAPFEFVVKKV